MPKRESVLLAHKYDSKKHSIGGWFCSTKLDGMRCLSDGGVSRGISKSLVPWANVAKDNRYLRPPIATGLWSRYHNTIVAPDWWLDMLPPCPLDGELYCEEEKYRQNLFSIIKDQSPTDEAWKGIKYYVFDMPSPMYWLMDGEIKTTNFTKSFKGCYSWWKERAAGVFEPSPATQFITTVELMKQQQIENDVVVVHKQERLPFSEMEAVARMKELCTKVVEAGGEGLILRKDISNWVPERSHNLLKVKPTEDAEGVVVGYVSGRETDKGSKLLGLMGALVIRLANGQELELSGFTDYEREFEGPEATRWATEHPGETMPAEYSTIHFKRGSVVTFKYRGLSNTGIPNEARYFRKRSDI